MRLHGFILIVFLSCNSASERYSDQAASTSSLNARDRGENSKVGSSSKNILTYKIIASEEGTFGYNIYNKDKIFIHQPHRPGLPGTKGFRERAEAEQVAQLVIRKIQAGEILPAITMEEMKQLGIIK